LIIDDEIKLRSLLARIIKGEGYEVLEAADGSTGLKHIENQDIDAVLCDVRLPDIHGLELIGLLKAKNRFAEIILLTANGNIADGVKAMKNGAMDYIVKGDDNDKILPLLAKAVEKAHLQKKLYKLESIVSQKFSFDTIIGNSQALKNVIELAKKVAHTDTVVLLTGETGTGKEVFAQAIHHNSSRSDKNFVALNCSAFGREMMESELFGYKQGAFTGAIKDKKGLLEEAHNGTLFLDEIADLSPTVQVKLLRVLQERAFERVGGVKTLNVDIRLIAASNCDLEQQVEAGRFRRDLFYRLNVVPLTLPPLRARKEDIPMLAAHFAQKAAEKYLRPEPQLDPLLLDALQEYEWPGNVRELENVMERLVVLTNGQRINLEFLPEKMLRVLPNANLADESTLEGGVAALKRRMILKALQTEGGNKVAAAKRLGISRSYLHRLISEFGM